MSTYPLIATFLSLGLSALFFIPVFTKFKLNSSLLAGGFISYFFFAMLPEIAKYVTSVFTPLAFLRFSFIVIGFTLILLVEKLILQKVDIKSQKRMRKLVKKEQILEVVEKNIEILLTTELRRDDLDEAALREIARTLYELNEQEEEFKLKINKYKQKIQRDISTNLANLRYYVFLIYHIFVGFIMVGILEVDIFSGLFFFTFTFLVAFALERREPKQIFSDLEIFELEIEESRFKKYLMASAALIGVGIGIPFLWLVPFSLELQIIFVLFSIISGVFLFLIVKEFLPEKEKGSIKLFIIGLLGFTALVLIFELIDIYFNPFH